MSRRLKPRFPPRRCALKRCRNIFTPAREWQKFCCTAHNAAHAKEPVPLRRKRCALERCNQLFRPVKPYQKFCSTEHRLEYHHKTEAYSKAHDELVDLARKEVRAIWLQLETNPPPALIARLADLVKEEIAKDRP